MQIMQIMQRRDTGVGGRTIAMEFTAFWLAFSSSDHQSWLKIFTVTWRTRMTSSPFPTTCDPLSFQTKICLCRLSYCSDFHLQRRPTPHLYISISATMTHTTRIRIPIIFAHKRHLQSISCSSSWTMLPVQFYENEYPCPQSSAGPHTCWHDANSSMAYVWSKRKSCSRLSVTNSQRVDNQCKTASRRHILWCRVLDFPTNEINKSSIRNSPASQ